MERRMNECTRERNMMGVRSWVCSVEFPPQPPFGSLVFTQPSTLLFFPDFSPESRQQQPQPFPFTLHLSRAPSGVSSLVTPGDISKLQSFYSARIY